MKLLLNIKDNKVLFLPELLKNFPFVIKATIISEPKAELMKYTRESGEELKLLRQRKLKARNAEDLIDEL